jgi:hypothetical protein
MNTKTLSSGEELLLAQIKLLKLPVPVSEYRFHATRKWRFDMAWPSHKLAVEVEGIGGPRSRHLSWVGFHADCEKYNTAVIMGWRVLRVTAQQVESGQAVEWLEQAWDMESLDDETASPLDVRQSLERQRQRSAHPSHFRR